MDIVVKGRNVEVPDHYRMHVEEKLGRLERYDRKIGTCDVELFHEPNRRQHKNCQRVEVTTWSRGQAVRAEATAGDFYAALDCAASKLENRLRRLHDRRRVHHGRRCPTSVGQATAGSVSAVAVLVAEPEVGVTQPAPTATALLDQQPEPEQDFVDIPHLPQQRWNDGLDDSESHLPGRIVREKEHSGKPMTVDQALYEMELVGHDFYLYFDVDSGHPSVVYRRKGFAYGLVRMA
ncbi:MAG TPA: ribosome-associated translation inhibitor RaiA [Pseudonocardiaceae bacterium]|jgi:ribosomal subunit interface protein|nr:ribosome-associated translation inhibitor RaiA [Pseudonocardiaceae bacterium]